MSRNDHLRRLGHRLAAARKTLQRDDEMAVEQLLELSRDVEAPLDPGSDQPAGRAQLIGVLDEAGTLRDLLEQRQRTLRQEIDVEARRRLGRAAYRPAPRG